MRSSATTPPIETPTDRAVASSLPSYGTSGCRTSAAVASGRAARPVRRPDGVLGSPGALRRAARGTLRRRSWRDRGWPESRCRRSSRPGWAQALAPVEPVIAEVGEFLRAELAAGRRYLPAGANVLRAFTQPFDEVRVLIVGPGPVPDARARRRPVVLGGAGRPPDPAVARQHLPGVQQRPRPPRAVHRRPHAVGRAGGAAAQQGAHRRARAAPARTAGRAGRPSPSRRSARWSTGRASRWWRSSGAATPAT